ncbi:MULTISPECIES: hypothetical protein [Bacillus]|nr:hypothetical protein [Bacillus cereus]MBJ7955698.1 hypothetical protein [Bacillus cereus]MBT0793088.1 hypothetical protein [Bacillus cereus]MDZ4452899.1 hypothetical protein [Bacillus cereus]MDZ4610781.1 hypothetical protein [Bacillus cereus]
MDKLIFMNLDKFNNRVHMVDSGVYLITDVEETRKLSRALIRKKAERE